MGRQPAFFTDEDYKQHLPTQLLAGALQGQKTIVPVKHIHLYLQEFEDLDEIIARHIQPMAASVRDIIGHRYYKEIDDKREVIEKLLADDKKKTPSK